MGTETFTWRIESTICRASSSWDIDIPNDTGAIIEIVKHHVFSDSIQIRFYVAKILLDGIKILLDFFNVAIQPTNHVFQKGVKF